MAKLPLISALLVSLSLARPVHSADCVPASGAAQTAPCVVGVEWAGTPGVWMTREETATRAGEAATLRRHVAALLEADVLRRQQAGLLTSAAEAQQAATEAESDRAESEAQRADRAEKALAERTSAWVWVGTGGVVGTLATVLLWVAVTR
jgi:hypothetical protein